MDDCLECHLLAKVKAPEIPILDIPITDSDREILLSIGKIKKQKQRPSVDRLFNICNKFKDKYPLFGSKEGIETVLNDMIDRKLLQRVVSDTEKQFISYREMNSAIAVVALTNPKRSRAKPSPTQTTPTAITDSSKRLSVSSSCDESE